MWKHRKYQKYSDDELVSLIKINGDNYPIGIFYERYGHLVIGVCLKYLRNEQDAQDITSHLFEQLQLKIERSEIQHFKSWLYRVTTNECLQFIRKYRPTLAVEELQIQAEDYSNEQEHQEFQLQKMEQALGTLKEDQRQCIELFYLQNKSYVQIAELLQMELNKVKSAIQNGKRNLKISLENDHEFQR